MRAGDIGLAVAVAFVWGSTFPISGVLLESLPPILLTALRFVCAATLVLVVPRPAVPWRRLVAMALLLGAGQFGFLFLAIANGLPPGLASLLIHTQAFFTIGISIVVFREGLTPRQAWAVLLAAAGLLVLAADRSGGGVPAAGLTLVLCGALSAACGNTVLKGVGAVDMVGVAVWMSAVVPLPLLALSAAVEGDGGWWRHVAGIGWGTVLGIVYLGVPATVGAYTVWGRLFGRYRSAQVMPFFLLVPVFGIGLSALLLGERLTVQQAAGAAMIFAGLTMATLRRLPWRRG